mmetsp:Transcript_5275/g.15548  ORF Transcript_5275/g.15548 Transcript_5275/m.15548 type:complete len:104 (-) Transcript_5275:68-379(-)
MVDRAPARMMTAKYDMVKMKQLMEIDDTMKNALCALHGCADEDGLPDEIQEIDFGGTNGEIAPEYTTVEALLAVFKRAMPGAPEARLRDIAESTVKQLGGLEK